MTLSEAEKAHRVALSHFPKIGAVRMRILFEALGSATAIWSASRRDLQGLPRFSPKLLESFIQFRREQDPMVLYQSVLAQGIQCRFPEESLYPEQLRRIYDPPAVLYWRGQPECWAQLSRCVAIIGTREPTPYGSRIAHRLAESLARQGVTIISGMALGIDTLAHQGALYAQGQTVAVLGSGLKHVFPAQNQKLYTHLCQQGLVLSELPPQHPPQTWTFPARNRIVSGLAQAVIVVEAGLKSGTLITVDCANEQGREVFAVPGPLGSEQSQGTHALIQQGAHLLSHPDEVLNVLGWEKYFQENTPLPLPENLTNSEEQVYVLLGEQPLHVDVLASQVPLEAQEVLGLLTFLELKGLAQALPGKLYKRTPRF